MTNDQTSRTDGSAEAPGPQHEEELPSDAELLARVRDGLLRKLS